jgi:phosphoserine aminotransferase
MRNVLDVFKKAGGLAAVEKRNREKAQLLYGAIDGQGDFYRCPVEKESRSVMNIVFNLPTSDLEADFLAGAQKRGLVGLKGHRSVGGVRVSAYNAVPLESVEKLVDYMAEFRKAAS